MPDEIDTQTPERVRERLRARIRAIGEAARAHFEPEPFISAQLPTPSPQATQAAEQEHKGILKAAADDLVGLFNGVIDAVRLVGSYTPPVLVYRSLAWDDSDRRDGIYSLGIQDITKGIYEYVTDSHARKEAHATMGANAQMIIDNAVPIWNWWHYKEGGDPIQYFQDHPVNFLLDISVIGSAASGSAKALRAAGMSNKVVEALGKAGQTMARAPELPLKAVPPTLKKAGDVMQKLGLIRPAFRDSVASLSTEARRRMASSPIIKRLSNQKQLIQAKHVRALKGLSDAIEDISRIEIPQELWVEASKYFANAYESLEDTKNLFMTKAKWDEAKWAQFNDAVQVTRERIRNFTQQLIHDGLLDENQALEIAVDIPLRFSNTVKGAVKARGVTDEEIVNFLQLPAKRKLEITRIAVEEMDKLNRTPVYFPTHVVDEEMPVIAVVNYWQRKIGEWRKQIAENERMVEEAGGDDVAVARATRELQDQVEMAQMKIERYKTDPNRLAIREEANAEAAELVKRGEISRGAIKPTSMVEQMIRDFSKFAGESYKDPNALIAGEFARRVFGYPFHYSLRSTLRMYLDNMIKYFTAVDWSNWVFAQFGKPLRGMSPKEITQLANQGWMAGSPEVIQNIWRMHTQGISKFIMDSYNWSNIAQATLQEITEGVRTGKITPEKFQQSLQTIFGEHSATGLAKKVEATEIYKTPIKVAEDVHRLQEIAPGANWYMIHPDAAYALLWDLPRPSLFDTIVSKIPAGRRISHSLHKAWIWQVLSNPRFVLNNLVGHFIFHILAPISAEYIGRGMMIRNAAADIMYRAARMPMERTPYNFVQAAKNRLVSLYDASLGQFMKWADNTDKLSKNAMFAAAFLSDPLVAQLREVARKSGIVARDIDLLETVRELAQVKTTGETIAAELRVEIARTKEILERTRSEYMAALTQVGEPIADEAIRSVERQVRTAKIEGVKARRITFPKEQQNRVIHSVNLQIESVVSEWDAFFANIETAITDAMRSLWMQNPTMNQTQWWTLLRQTYFYLDNPDILRTFLNATLPANLKSDEALKALAAMEEIPPQIRRALVEAAATLRVNSNGSVEVQRMLRTMATHVTPKNNPVVSLLNGGIPLQIQAKVGSKTVTVPVVVPYLDLTEIMRARLRIIPNEMAVTLMEIMDTVARNNPLVFVGMNAGERRALFDIALTPSTRRAEVIAKIEDTVKQNYPLVNQALGMDVRTVMERALQNAKDWVYYTGNVNPALRYALAGWMPFYGFMTFIARYMARNVILHPQQMMMYGKFNVLAQELDSADDDPLLRNRILIGRDAVGNGIYLSIGGQSPHEQVKQALDSIKRGDWVSAVADHFSPVIKSGVVTTLGRTLPSFQAIEDGETIYLSNGRAVRWNAAEQTMERNVGLSIGDRFEALTASYLGQHPIYEIAQDITLPYQKQPYKWLWNAKPRYRLTEDGQWQISNYPWWHYVARLSGFTARGEQDIKEMRNLLEIHKRQTIRQLVRNIRNAKTPEERAHWQEQLEQWQRTGLKIR